MQLIQVTTSPNPARPYVIAQLEKHDAQHIDQAALGKRETLDWHLLNEHHELQGALYAYLHWKAVQLNYLWVHPNQRRKGYGTKLVAAVEQAARARNCTHLLVETASFHAPEFYRALGFAESGVLRDFPEAGMSYWYLHKKI